MRKLAPVFLISIFALSSTGALAMGDRQKSKKPADAATTTAPATEAKTVGTSEGRATPADSPPSATTTPSTTSSMNGATKSASPSAPELPAKSAATDKTNPARTATNCINGKDTATGKDCQALGGDSSGPGASGSGAASSGSSSSSSGSAAGSSK